MNSSLPIQTLYRQMASYAHWKNNLAAQLQKYQQWFADHRFSSAEAQYSLRYALDLLARDRITLAVVGGPSRGKSELINALLFDHYGLRPFASPSGQPLRCTTEIYWDPQQPGGLRLLPVETRRQASGVEHFRRMSQAWVSVSFNARDPVQVRSATASVGQVKTVTRANARLLGFDCMRQSPSDPDKVEIPAWRHALINLEHPLLRLGLRMVLVPGIDVLNNEPELSLHTLCAAQNLLFLVNAATGAGPEDMAIWKGHLQKLCEYHGGGLLALVNKIDVLLEEADSDDEKELTLHATRETLARQLGLPLEQVLALSTKQGLLAKAARHQGHLQSSHLLHLEMVLAQRVLEHQRRLACDRTLTDVIAMLAGTRETLHQRLFDCDAQREQLEHSLSRPAQQAALQTMRAAVREFHNRCHKHALALRSSQRQLQGLLPELTAPVSSTVLRQRFTALKERLAQNSSPLGLIQAIAGLFQQLSLDFGQLSEAVAQANRVLTSIYRRSEPPAGQEEKAAFSGCPLFDLAPYQQRLLRLKHQADQFHAAAGALPLPQQHTPLKRFIQALIQEVRRLFEDIQRDIGHWNTQALALIGQSTQCHKQLLERQLLLLANLHNSHYALQAPLHDFRTEIADLEAALYDLDKICHHLQPAPAASPLPTSVNVIRLRSQSQLVV